ncbi:GGDEF domain-containing protein [Nitrococcus mobilis]|uniref:GGDEF domain-containing protein n=1 Tax=Nitrococcus mobilis TaxID=35797 RepID=UPI00032201F9|nr:sensor domain-containing diguanylate cyclase [Nitrococcus mobilis]
MAVLNTALDRVGRSGCGDAASLVLPSRHSALVQHRRATLIISRVRIVAGLFALLTPWWILVDYYAFSWPLWGILTGSRVLASLAFGILACSFARSDAMPDAYHALSLLLAIPTLFYLFSHPLMSAFNMDAFASMLAVGYAFLPFVMVAGLAMFPITALEGLLFALPSGLAVLLVAFMQLDVSGWAEYAGSMWLLLLISMVATLAGIMQLHFMMVLVVQASHDTLTKGFTRRTGEELLGLLYRQAERQKTPLALAFMDLDNFKSINDTYGHDEGDNALRQAAKRIQEGVRRGDILVRWGGEEFLVIMPNTDIAGARIAIDRLHATGFGYRPNGSLLTASIGVAERLADDTASWMRLVELADQRMYRAKQHGKNRAVLTDGQEVAA